MKVIFRSTMPSSFSALSSTRRGDRIFSPVSCNRIAVPDVIRDVADVSSDGYGDRCFAESHSLEVAE